MARPQTLFEGANLTEFERRLYWAGYDRGYSVGRERQKHEQEAARLERIIRALETKLATLQKPHENTIH